MNTSPKAPYQIGRIHELTILRLVSIGAYLEWADEDGVLLPIKYLPLEAQVGDRLSVFVYHDNEGRPIATTLVPHAQVGETAYLRCVSLSGAGAFLDWGIHKDLFVPYAEQRERMQEGRSYIVHLYIDHASGKVVGSAKLTKHIGNTLPSYKVGQEVSARFVDYNDHGYRCIVDHVHWGIVYYDDITDQPHRGEVVRAWVRRLREDGRIDLSLRPVGYDRVEGDTTRLVRLLRGAGGTLAIGDKSDPDEIQRLTGMSKRSFKMAVGALYRARRLSITPTSITLID